MCVLTAEIGSEVEVNAAVTEKKTQSLEELQKLFKVDKSV
jgi:hypothetical protein